MLNTLQANQNEDQNTIDIVLNDFQQFKINLDESIAREHSVTDCTSCTVVQPKLQVHRQFCTDDDIITRMIHVFEQYCRLASQAWTLEQAAPKTSTYQTLEETLHQLADLKIDVKSTAGSLPKHNLDRTAIPQWNVYENRLPHTKIYTIDTHKLARDIQTQANALGSGFDPQNYLTQLKEVDQLSQPYTDTQESIQAAPNSNILRQLGEGVVALGPAILAAASAGPAAGAAVAATTAATTAANAATEGSEATATPAGPSFAARISSGLRAGMDNLSGHLQTATPSVRSGDVIIANGCAPARRRANDAFRIVKAKAETSINVIEQELQPKIEELKKMEVPKETIDLLTFSCNQANLMLREQVRTASSRLYDCREEMVTAFDQHKEKQECYDASKLYIDETVQEMHQTMARKLREVDLTSFRKTGGTLKELKDNYKQSLDDFTAYITCQVGNENGFCSISKDPLIKETTQYYLEKLHEMCSIYYRELANRRTVTQLLWELLNSLRFF